MARLRSPMTRHGGLRPATEQPKKSCGANSESKRKNRPKEAPKPRLLRQSALSAFELLEFRQSRTAGLAGVTMYPVSGSPISKDSLRGLSRQWSAISTHNTDSIYLGPPSAAGQSSQHRGTIPPFPRNPARGNPARRLHAEDTKPLVPAVEIQADSAL